MGSDTNQLAAREIRQACGRSSGIKQACNSAATYYVVVHSIARERLIIEIELHGMGTFGDRSAGQRTGTPDNTAFPIDAAVEVPEPKRGSRRPMYQWKGHWWKYPSLWLLAGGLIVLLTALCDRDAVKTATEFILALE